MEWISTGWGCEDVKGHDTICLTCSGKKREDLLDRAEVVEVLARLTANAYKECLAEEREDLRDLLSYRKGGIGMACNALNVWQSVVERARELEEEREGE